MTKEQFLSLINKGTFGIHFLACTEPTMNKGRGANRNPFLGRVKKITYTQNIALGYDYASYNMAQMKKQGIPFVKEEILASVEKPSGKHWVDYPYILASDKDASVKYLRTYFNKASKSKPIYLLDGNIVRDERTLEAIDSWIPKKSNTTKFGVDVTLRDFKFENILVLKQGDKVFNKFDGLFSAEQVIQFIKELE